MGELLRLLAVRARPLLLHAYCRLAFPSVLLFCAHLRVRTILPLTILCPDATLVCSRVCVWQDARLLIEGVRSGGRARRGSLRWSYSWMP